MRALVSVSDKSNLDVLASFFKDHDVDVISSGGTAKALRELGLKVTPVEDITGNPEAFGGRMKTLSFQISSGILFQRDKEEDVTQAKELSIVGIDLVVCNLYPFAEVKRKGGSWNDLVENIDIGGPTMVRAAAKNHKSVWVLTNPGQYSGFIEHYSCGEALALRTRYAMEAFKHCAGYDAMIAQSFEEKVMEEVETVHVDLKEARATRYGENPHQKGFVWGDKGLAGAVPLQGKELSYNNYLDADAAWRSMIDLKRQCGSLSCVTIIKHSNPCGASASENAMMALENAWAADPISAFGSIIAFSEEVTAECAQFIVDRFVEVVMAPKFNDEAKKIFSQKKNLRLLELSIDLEVNHSELMVKTIDGGYVLQHEDTGVENDIRCVTKKDQVIDDELLRFGIKCCKHLKSNAICLVYQNDSGYHLAGAGMGNPNRLISLQQAVDKAKDNGFTDMAQMILVSDAFFPFRDNIDLAAGFGINTIVQPGGSIKDNEVIAACDEHNIQMFFTQMRHFRH